MKRLYDNANGKYVELKDILFVNNKIYSIEAINYTAESVSVREGININNPRYSVRPEYLDCYFVHQ